MSTTMTDNQPATGARTTSRSTAWTTPVIVMVAAAPAYAVTGARSPSTVESDSLVGARRT